MRLEQERGAIPRWEHFSHQADVGVRGVGRSLDEAFEQAALGMIGVLADPATIAPAEAVQVSCTNDDTEMLLVDWLNTLLCEMATRRMLFGRFAVRVDRDRLEATAWGEPVDAARHQPAVEVKGASYAALRVARDDAGIWTAQCIVDV